MRRTWLAALLVAAIAAGIYAPTLRHELVWDDPAVLDQLRQRVARDGVAGLFAPEFAQDPGAGHPGSFRPVVSLSLWLDDRLSGGRPAYFHLTNILLHAGASVLVLLLLQEAVGGLPAALLGALIFALHPGHVESVAFVSGRTDLWAALFTFAGALCWLREARAPARRPWLLRAGGALFLVLGGLSKEVALLLPAVLLAWDLLRGAGGDAAQRPRLLRWLGVWGVGIGAVVALRVLAGVGWGVGLQDRVVPGSAGVSSGTALLNFVKLLLLPWPPQVIYTPDQVRIGATVLLAVLAFAGVCVAAARAQDRRAGLAALVWTIGFLVPVLGVMRPNTAAVAERFLYLPSFGLSLAVAALVARVPAHLPGRRVVAAGAAAILLLAGVATLRRERVWRDDVSLFSDVMQTSPLAAAAPYNLGKALAERGRTAEAVEAYRWAAATDPGFAQAPYNLGIALQALGRDAEAIEAFQQAANADPRMLWAHNNLGISYGKTGQYDKAEASFRTAIALDPGNADLRFNLGSLLEMMRRPEEARAAYGDALRLRPDYTAARFRIEVLARQLGTLTSPVR